MSKDRADFEKLSKDELINVCLLLEADNAELKHQTQRMINYLNPLLEIAKCSVK